MYILNHSLKNPLIFNVRLTISTQIHYTNISFDPAKTFHSRLSQIFINTSLLTPKQIHHYLKKESIENNPKNHPN